jgi:hypothetical protein
VNRRPQAQINFHEWMNTSHAHDDATTDGVRIAMWSGPRNISTALMRSWSSRPDTVVCDEPLYAHYLKQTGREHPGRDDIIARHDADWRSVVEQLTGPVPGGGIFYQKHMAHHLLPEMDRDWVLDLRSAFLIRDPAEMLPSLAEVLPNPVLRDTGLEQQWELFQYVQDAASPTPPVIDAKDVLLNPEGMLRALCIALDVPFHDAMLSWAPGPRATDGTWATYWYDAVEQSTGFEPYKPKTEPVPDRLQPLYATCQDYYQPLAAHRLQPAPSDEADVQREKP